MCLIDCFFQVESEFILESERESFIEQVREVIENADQKGLERDASNQVRKSFRAFVAFLPFLAPFRYFYPMSYT